MNIKRQPIVFHNLLCISDSCKQEDWGLIALTLNKYAIVNGLYATGPTVFTYAQSDDTDELYDFTVYLPVNASFEPDEEDVTFISELKFEDVLSLRIPDLEDTVIQETYLLLEACAEELNCKIVRPFYHVGLNVYDDQMMDVFVAIEDNDGK
jgi:hypothetical protein